MNKYTKALLVLAMLPMINLAVSPKEAYKIVRHVVSNGPKCIPGWNCHK